MFLPFPICIYWAVFLIITGDPGRITHKLQSEIYKEYGIVESEIGIKYD
jgi:hypothetical protein